MKTVLARKKQKSDIQEEYDESVEEIRARLEKGLKDAEAGNTIRVR